MRKRTTAGLKCLAHFGLAMIATCSQAVIRIEASPLFEGRFGNQYAPPVRVRLFNDGKPVRGTVDVDSSPFLVPVDLPTGVTKEFVAAPGTNITSVVATFSAPGVQVRSKESLINQTGSPQTVLSVGGNPGDLDFLISSGESKKGGTSPNFLAICYASPEDTPVRFSHLMGLTAIVLGEGADRLSGQSIDAIRAWVQLGGTLVLLGGPSRATLDLPGIQEILPVKVGDPSNLRLSNNETVTVRRGQPFIGAKEVFETEGINAFARPYGLGSVVYTNANLAEPVFQTWSGRRSLYQALRISRAGRVSSFLANSQGFGQYENMTRWSGSYAQNFGGSAFSVTLPPTSQVAVLLVFYMVIVLPVNFLILRKMKKLEWAWFTCPVISAVFAFAFVQQGSNLYQAENANWTQGLLVSNSTGEGCSFSGYSQAFFRDSGVQDLKLKGVDWMVSSEQTGMGLSKDEKLIDVGTIVANNISTRPLEFKQFDYRCQMPSQKGVALETLSLTPKDAVYRITNRTDEVLNGNTLVAMGQAIPVPKLGVGQSLTQRVSRRPLTQKERDSWYKSADPIYSSLVPTSSEDRSAFFVASLTNFTGPLEAGENLPSSVRLVVAADLGKELAGREVWR